MLIILITTITVAIPLKSLSYTRWARIGFVALLLTLFLIINLSSPVLGAATFKDTTFSPVGAVPLYNGFMKTSYITNTMDLLLLLVGAFLLSSNLFSFTSLRPLSHGISAVLKRTGANINERGFASFASLEENERLRLEENHNHIGESWKKSETSPSKNESILLALCTLLGSIILVGSNDILSLLLGIELQSYSLYILASTSHFSEMHTLEVEEMNPSHPFNSEASKRKGDESGFYLGTGQQQKLLNVPFISHITPSFTRKSIHEPSEAAGLKYYLLGALASALILLGIAILYAATGSTGFAAIKDMFMINGDQQLQRFLFTAPELEVIDDTLVSYFGQGTLSLTFASIGLLLISIGIIWKFAGAPLHNWAVDVYDAIPTTKAAWLAIIPKIALLAIMGDLLLLPLLHSSSPWLMLSTDSNLYYFSETNGGTQLILLVSILSMIIGAVGALTQPLIKRLLAYSSIGQLGFILLGMSLEHTGAMAPWTVFYLSQYSITNAGIWLCLAVTPFKTPALGSGAMLLAGKSVIKTEVGDSQALGDTLSSIKNQTSISENKVNKIPYLKIDGEIRSITELQGLHEKNIFIALAFTIFMFSLAGIPPMIGFFAKLEIISASLNKGYVFISIIAIICSLISAAYYLKVVRYIFFSTNDSSNANITNNYNIKNVSLHRTEHYQNHSFKEDREQNQKNITYTAALIISLILIIVSLFLLQANVIFMWCKLVGSV